MAKLVNLMAVLHNKMVNVTGILHSLKKSQILGEFSLNSNTMLL